MFFPNTMDVRPQLTYQFPVMEIDKLDGDAKRQLHVACLNGNAKRAHTLFCTPAGCKVPPPGGVVFFGIFAMGFIP